MLIIGLTGGIGSGKSTVAKHFKELGIEVVDADQKSRDVVEPGQPALFKIAEKFGSDILLDDGHLDRAKLRGIIFSSDEDRLWLESLLHPLIRDSIKSDLESASSAYVILESPLLFETDQHQMINHSLLVDVSEDTQIQRTCDRDDNNEEQVKRIISAQMPRSLKQEKADYIIDNEVSLDTLETSVKNFHQQFLMLAHNA